MQHRVYPRTLAVKNRRMPRLAAPASERTLSLAQRPAAIPSAPTRRVHPGRAPRRRRERHTGRGGPALNAASGGRMRQAGHVAPMRRSSLRTDDVIARSAARLRRAARRSNLVPVNRIPDHQRESLLTRNQKEIPPHPTLSPPKRGGEGNRDPSLRSPCGRLAITSPLHAQRVGRPEGGKLAMTAQGLTMERC